MMLQFLREHKVPGGRDRRREERPLVYSRGFGYADGKAVPSSPIRCSASPASPSRSRPSPSCDSSTEDAQARRSRFRCPRPRGSRRRALDPRCARSRSELLQHTGGWDRDKSFDAMFINGDLQRAGRGAAGHARSDPPLHAAAAARFRSGQRYAYSNFGYWILGRVIEKLTGRAVRGFRPGGTCCPAGPPHAPRARSLRDRLPDEVRITIPADEAGRSWRRVSGNRSRGPTAAGVWSSMDSHGGWVASAVTSSASRRRSTIREAASC